MFFDRTNGTDATNVSHDIIHPKSQRDGPMSAQASGLGCDRIEQTKTPKGWPYIANKQNHPNRIKPPRPRNHTDNHDGLLGPPRWGLAYFCLAVTQAAGLG